MNDLIASHILLELSSTQKILELSFDSSCLESKLIIICVFYTLLVFAFGHVC